MPPEITIRRHIQWFDTDSSTKYHNTAPLRLMEEAEAALLDELGIVHEVYGFMPRVHVSLDYRSPLRFWDEVEITVRVAELGRTSITYTFEVRSEGRTAAEGTVVAAYIDGEGTPRAWPDRYRRLLDPAAAT
jgi:acyl-CoA thioester hydrolase